VNPVLLDVPDSWPTTTAEAVAAVGRRLRGTTRHVTDLRVSEAEDAAVAASLEGHLVRVYHCTRLLDAERDDILRNGLRPASDTLAHDRLEMALAGGHLDGRQARDLYARRALARQRNSREHRICAVSTRASLNAESGLHHLLGTWGGELLYFDSLKQHRQVLQSLGRPSVVVLDLPADLPNTGWYPYMAKVLTAVALDFPDVEGEVNATVTQERWPVVDIWQPGHAEYSKHPHLPLL